MLTEKYQEQKAPPKMGTKPKRSLPVLKKPSEQGEALETAIKEKRTKRSRKKKDVQHTLVGAFQPTLDGISGVGDTKDHRRLGRSDADDASGHL